MPLSKTENVSKSFIWGLIYRCAGILLPFITRTVIIYKMGNIYLGLNGLLTSILNLFSLAELGIGSALVYSMYKPMAEENTEEICELLNLYKKAYRIIGVTILLMGLCFLPFITNVIQGEIPDDVNIHVLYLIYLFNTVISYFLFSYRQSLFLSSQRVDIINIIMLVVVMFQNIMQISILYFFKSYYAYIMILPIATILNNLLSYIISKRKFPNYVAKGNVSTKRSAEIKKNVSALMLGKVGVVIRSSTDNMVISAFLGLTLVGIYNNYSYITNALMMIFSIIMGSLIPSVGNSLITENNNNNFKYFCSFNLLYVWLVSWASITFLCLCQPFIEIWTGSENLLPFSTVVLFTLYLYTHKFCDMMFVYQEAAGFWWQTKFVSLTAAVVNLAVSIILVNIIGINGVIIGTIVSIVLINNVGYALKIFKKLFQTKSGMKKYFISQIYFSICFLIAGTITYFCCRYFSIDSLVITIIIRFFICIILPNLILIPAYRLDSNFMDAKLYVLKALGSIIKRGNCYK